MSANREEVAKGLARELGCSGWQELLEDVGEEFCDALISREMRLIELREVVASLKAGMTPSAHARVRKTIDILGDCSDGWMARAKKTEADLIELRERVAELQQIFSERHYMGTPLVKDGFAENVVMVGRDWYNRLASILALRDAGEGTGKA